jgi:hypothetical protein
MIRKRERRDRASGSSSDTAAERLMRLYSYIVARDYGFAPNPFHGYCTLATCKPKIRAGAAVGDWIVGTGAKTRYQLAGHLIYAMKISETLDYDAYWSDPRFICKRPVLNGSLKLMYGDNIYHRNGRRWVQADSHHSLESGRPNPKNIAHDTSVNRLLLSTRFVYWGHAAPTIPKRFRHFRATEEDLCCPGQGHRVMSEKLTATFEQWIASVNKWGVQGLPLEFEAHPRADAPSDDRGRERRVLVGAVRGPMTDRRRAR